MVFPNDRYPENEARTALNPRGEKTTYHYYPDDSSVYFFSARARFDRKRELAIKTLALAQLVERELAAHEPAAAMDAIVNVVWFVQHATGRH
jgi:hypothetical protein